MPEIVRVRCCAGAPLAVCVIFSGAFDPVWRNKTALVMSRFWCVIVSLRAWICSERGGVLNYISV
jgi:hypothetical protein